MHAKGKHRRVGWIITGAAVAFLLYLLLGAVLPNRIHLTVRAEDAFDAEEFSDTADNAGGEEVRYISDNTEAMEFRLAMLEAAQQSVILSTFDFNADTAGRELISALLHTAERGVKIQIIVDGVSGAFDVTNSGWFQALADHENVELKIYNPLNLFLPWKMMYRMHDKYLIVDESMYLLGGRNSTDLFLGDHSDRKNIDSEVFVRRVAPAQGDSTAQLLDYFDRIWNAKESVDYWETRGYWGNRRAEMLAEIYETLPDTYPAAFEPNYPEQAETLPADKITLLTNPIEAVNKEPTLWCDLTGLMAGADDVLAVTPYAMLSDEMKDDLATVCAETENFTLMLNDAANGANPWGCADYLNERDEILSLGLTAAEFQGGHSMHTKNILLDDHLSLVGSFNFDMRSAYLDTELMLVIDSAPLNACLRENLEEALSCCRFLSSDEIFEGENFEGRALSGRKAIGYAVLRRLILPFRCIL